MLILSSHHADSHAWARACDPAQAPGSASAANTEASVALPGSGPRLLYIEDHPVNQLVVEELLSKRPAWTLRCADDGRQGLACALDWRPDLILLDMELPDLHGCQVLARLRGDPRSAAIPCIALSANAMPDDVDRACRDGFAAYWTKPIDFKAFLQGLDRFAEAWSSRQAAQR